MSVSLNIEKDLGGFVLKAEFEAGDEVLALLGASGCGKSLTLKCIAGIERPDRGHIEVDGVTLFDSERGIDLSPQRRRTGLMFQNYALFPNMTVLENIRAGARREPDRRRREENVRGTLRKFGLEALRKRYPHELSGGQQQRVALARILVSAPGILLLDEPFSALDSHLRFRLERELRRTAEEFGRTVILVSHDRDEVFRLSDRIAVMAGGRVEVCGARDEIFARPGTVNAAVITGCKNIAPCIPQPDGSAELPLWGLKLRPAELPGGCTHIGVRMHDVLPGDGENSFEARVVETICNPFTYTLMLRAGDSAPGCIGAELPREDWERVKAERLRFHILPEKILPLKESQP